LQRNLTSSGIVQFDSMMTMKSADFSRVVRSGVLLPLAVVVVVLAVWVFYWSPESRAASAYESAFLGQEEAAVVAKAGTPAAVGPCGEYLWWNGDQENPPKNDGKCVKWVRYNFFLHAFAFGYSADGKLVSRYEYFSE
jgi:hypothetical protein